MKRIIAATLSLLFSAHLISAEDYDTRAWLKGNTHTHSLWSDGNDFPEMIADWYKERGYNFLVLSDHNTLSRGERWMSVADISAARSASWVRTLCASPRSWSRLYSSAASSWST